MEAEKFATWIQPKGWSYALTELVPTKQEMPELRKSNRKRVLVVEGEVAQEELPEFMHVMEAYVVGRRTKEEGCTFIDMMQNKENPCEFIWAEGWKNGAAQELHSKTEWFKGFEHFVDAQKFVRFTIHWAFAEPNETLFIYEWKQQVEKSLTDLLEEELSVSQSRCYETDDRLVIKNRDGKEVCNGILARTTDFALIQDQFPMTVQLQTEHDELTVVENILEFVSPMALPLKYFDVEDMAGQDISHRRLEHVCMIGSLGLQQEYVQYIQRIGWTYAVTELAPTKQAMPVLMNSDRAMVLCVLAEIAPENLDEFKQVMEANVTGQRAEDGCIFIDFMQKKDRKDDGPCEFVWVEGWKNGAARDVHSKAECFKGFEQFMEAQKFVRFTIHWAFDEVNAARREIRMTFSNIEELSSGKVEAEIFALREFRIVADPNESIVITNSGGNLTLEKALNAPAADFPLTVALSFSVKERAIAEDLLAHSMMEYSCSVRYFDLGDTLGPDRRHWPLSGVNAIVTIRPKPSTKKGGSLKLVIVQFLTNLCEHIGTCIE